MADNDKEGRKARADRLHRQIDKILQGEELEKPTKPLSPREFIQQEMAKDKIDKSDKPKA